MKRRLLLTLIALFVISMPVFAQQFDGRGGRFDDDLIANMEGQWTLTRQIRGTIIKNELSATWALGHQFLQVQMKDTQVPARYEALVLIGYVYASQEYVAHWIDSFGAKFSAVGRGKRLGNSIEFRFEYPDGLFFNTFTWDPIEKTWQLRMENQLPDGRRSLFAIDTLQR